MPIRPAKLEKELFSAGFIRVPTRGKGGHRRYKHPDGRTTEIPFHTGELKRGTENKIRKDAGLK
ncbi:MULTISPECIES: type II toxin-antitoxin system HicA family toxin [Lactobacillaceae]|uniref:type II toxin-antitoxin system HicA family toxin n=1 Tax=Lactobacillaceae TaxID=33958 RepID=UPI00145719BC|nr:type II toxin-antitoxin system HicA family toxin [Lactobacillus sp. HBUAS51381]NLR10106.1 addiction module toxin, HicA family [Lactobacillus sp. HBUAS51381]